MNPGCVADAVLLIGSFCPKCLDRGDGVAKLCGPVSPEDLGKLENIKRNIVRPECETEIRKDGNSSKNTRNSYQTRHNHSVYPMSKLQSSLLVTASTLGLLFFAPSVATRSFPRL